MRNIGVVTADHGYVFARAPRMIYWEMTRACDLACLHCRAEAIRDRDPEELTAAEGARLLQQILEFGSPLPHVVFTGGDPLKRPDLLDLVAEGTRLGIGVSLAPSATGHLTREALGTLKAAGVQSLSLSLDGSTAARHDGFRGVPGCYQQTLLAARWVRETGIPLQINTLVTADTLDDLPALYGLVSSLNIMRWSLFFLIPVGRGRALRELSAQDAESVMDWLYTMSAGATFAVAATEAPHFRRIALIRMKAGGLSAEAIHRSAIGRGFGVRDGNGVMFISARGDVSPAGFLPVPVGNVRSGSPVAFYREHEVFVALRDPSRLRGKCGRCEYRSICGGSRARAFAHTGDYLASDPLCMYEP